MCKKIIKDQKYEEYWKLTLEYSDIYADKFNTVLDIIIRFIDDKKILGRNATSSEYKELQNLVEYIYPKKDSASTRKSINQFIKLGFVNSHLNGYHDLAKKFLSEQNNETKRDIFSKVLYSNASFNSSFSKDTKLRHINFFIKTLYENKSLGKDDVSAIISTNIQCYKNGFLTRKELDERKRFISSINFHKRKYNQIQFVMSIFKLLSNIIYDEKSSRFLLDQETQPIKNETKNKRDNYLHSLLKKGLFAESCKIYGKKVCYLDKKEYKVLIASHIKPFSKSEEFEKYEINNCLLLSQNADSLFDKGDISFKDDGNLISSPKTKKEYIDPFKKCSIDQSIMNDKRKMFMKFHRENVLKSETM